MSREALQKLLHSKYSDKMKETWIKRALAGQELDQESCISILDLGMSWVLGGEKPIMLSLGWIILQHLQEHNQNMLSEMLNSTMVEELLTMDGRVLNNGSQVPLLLEWYLKIIPSDALKEVIRCHITGFLEENFQNDFNVLVNTARFLCENDHCIPEGNELIRCCEVLIGSIGELPMPQAQSTEVAQLVKQMSHIEKFLIKVWSKSSGKYSEELVFRCLSVLHASITQNSRDPCPALSAVLHLVDPYMIPKSVRAIIQANEGHSRTFRTLCEWLLCWPRANKLEPWVLALVDGLESEQQFDVLMEVTLATVDRLFMAIILPTVRSGVVHIVYRMLAASHHNSQVFLKVLPKIPFVVKHLLQEDTDSSRSCVQMIVNMSYSMMTAFPRNEYEPLITALKSCSAFLPAGQFAPENKQNWCDGQMDFAECLKSKERLAASHVGLNNLGNTCYMNSVLQALFMTQRFCSAVLESDAQSQPVLSELQALFALLLHSRRCAISPTRLLTIARPPGFQPGHQQDSSEFLTYLLDVLHEQEKLTTSVSENVEIGGTGDEGTAIEGEAMETTEGGAMTRWTTEEDLSNQHILQRKARSLADFTQATGDDLQNLNNSHSNSTDSGIQSVCGDESAASVTSPIPHDSLVQQCFGGRLLISFKCLQCQAESVHTDHFRDIQLAFPPGLKPANELHIQDLLDYFISPEHLSGENQYRCDSCGDLRDAQKTIQILQSPSHLVLTLKRFQFNSRTGERTKLLHHILCSESIELNHQPYKLYAAVIHSGSSMDTGHYYTLARDESLTWHLFNDSIVAPCNPPPWSPPDTPYILFYARPEEQLKHFVDLATVPQLHSHLIELVLKDGVDFVKEVQTEKEKSRKRRKQQKSSLYSPNHHEQDDDNAGNPPGSCGEGMNLAPNRFVF